MWEAEGSVFPSVLSVLDATYACCSFVTGSLQTLVFSRVKLVLLYFLFSAPFILKKLDSI